MKLHREGKASILIASLPLIASLACLYLIAPWWLWGFFSLGFLVLFGLILWFFRIPNRTPNRGNHVLCPADGKVVVIEKTFEKEYFKDERIQISIFMSPLNVHAQYYPVEGEVSYKAYHPGKYLVAWHPKSSEENERSTVVVKNEKGQEILFRQIAGAVARRIVCYSKEGDKAEQGEEMGFIKFGSRVDVFLPLDAEIKVNLEQAVQGRLDVLAEC